MKVKLIQFSTIMKMPERAHYNDAGLDCFSTTSATLLPGARARIPLGFGLELPDGYVAFLLPRSSLNAKGIRVEVGTIDSGYRGEIQAVVVNDTNAVYDIHENDKIAQLVCMPVTYIEPIIEIKNDRNENGFGSTGK